MKTIITLLLAAFCLPLMNAKQALSVGKGIWCDLGSDADYRLTATFYDNADTTDVTIGVRWTTADRAIVDIEADGKLLPHTPGKAYVKAEYVSGDGGAFADSCLVSVVPASEGTMHTILDDDVILVGCLISGPLGIYHTFISGDTVVNGMTYKKSYRIFDRGIGGDRPAYRGTGGPVEAENGERDLVWCLREEGSRVYALCDESMTYHDLDYYPITANRTGTHYDRALYDFNYPNIYNKQSNEFTPLDDVVIDGRPRRAYKAGRKLMIEGIGAVFTQSPGSEGGCDNLCPALEMGISRIYKTMESLYVAKKSGEILIYEDQYGCTIYDESDGSSHSFPYHPYNLNDDGVLDIADLNELVNRLLGLPAAEIDELMQTPDLNFDGAVDIEDINMMVNQLLYEPQTVKVTDVMGPADWDAMFTPSEY